MNKGWIILIAAVIVVVIVFVIISRRRAAANAAGLQPSGMTVQPTPAVGGKGDMPGNNVAPGLSDYFGGGADPLANAKNPAICKAKCKILHPFSERKRTACELGCRQTGVTS